MTEVRDHSQMLQNPDSNPETILRALWVFIAVLKMSDEDKCVPQANLSYIIEKFTIRNK